MSDAPLTVSRRGTFAWMAAAAAAASQSLAFPGRAATPEQAAGWPAANLPEVTARGYGTDPDFKQKAVPWPLTLSARDREKIRISADLILPPDPGQKAPSALAIDAFFDEWVSAPYGQQKADRALILPGLFWLDTEANARFGRDFIAASDAQHRAIFDSIADTSRAAPDYHQPALFFDSLRRLTVLGYYTTPEGTAELGFVGDTPIQGLYPGPSAEALAHLRRQLDALGLAMPA
jgi:hypothetical protein